MVIVSYFVNNEERRKSDNYCLNILIHICLYPCLRKYKHIPQKWHLWKKKNYLKDINIVNFLFKIHCLLNSVCSKSLGIINSCLQNSNRALLLIFYPFLKTGVEFLVKQIGLESKEWGKKINVVSSIF